MLRPLIHRILPLIAILAIVWPALGQFTTPGSAPGAAGQQRQERVSAEMVLHDGQVVIGEQTLLGVVLTVQNEWKIQAGRGSGDEAEDVIPTEVRVTLPDGWIAGDPLWPAAEPFTIGEGEYAIHSMVYEGRIVVVVPILATDAAETGEQREISATIRYQACDPVRCEMPTTTRASLNANVVAEADPAPPEAAQLDESTAALFAKVLARYDGRVPELDPSEPAQRETAEPIEDDPDAAAPDDHDCDVLAELQHFTILGTGGGYLNSQQFINFIEESEAGTRQRSTFEGMGPLAIIALVIVGGLLLNLTPCVLPLIPINLAIIGAGARAGTRSRGFALGGAYGLAMALVYGGLGLIVIFTAASFGDLNSRIWFNVAIAVLFVFLALAMFDVISIDFTKFQSKLDASGLARYGMFPLALGMGAVTALLAGACIAPIVIAVIIYASDQYASGLTIALALPFFLGLGMALPWPFAGAGLSCLPKPGMWMVRVKQAMGVFILAFAGYYGYIAWGIWDSTRIDPNVVLASVAAAEEDGWHTSICAGLAEARAENKPVLIDMWATWCRACYAMDVSTFKDPAVLERLDGYVKIKYQAQDLNASPAREVLALFDGIGLPHYAILKPDAAGQ